VLLNDRHGVPPLLMCVSFRTPCPVEKTAGTIYRAAGREATPRTFWAAESRKSGVAPARFGVFSTVTLACAAFCIRLSSKKLLAPQGEETGEDEGGVCSPYLLHPFSSGSRSGTANRQSTSAAKCTVARRTLLRKSWRMFGFGSAADFPAAIEMFRSVARRSSLGLIAGKSSQPRSETRTG